MEKLKSMATSKGKVLSVEEIRKAVYALIEKHEPDKVGSVDLLMKKYKGKEMDLHKSLCDKFGEKYVKVQPAAIKSLYSIGSKLGAGGFAVVRKCKHRSSGVIYALKVINKKNLETDDLAILESEVSIMREVSHEYIVKLHDVFDSRSKMCLVLDMLEGGELFDRIIELGHFTERNAAESFGQLISALGYLHSKDIVHRDLKPENLLFAKKITDPEKFDAAEWNMKLIDFGLAGKCSPHPLKTPCGTPNYVAPEILRRQPYGTQVDMWSAGVILYIILCGFPPFYDEHDDLGRLYKKIKRADYDMPSPYFDAVSDSAKDLIQKLLVANPSERLTAEQTLKHPWLSGGASDTVLSDTTKIHLKRFQYIRKMKRGVRCVLAVLKLIEALTTEDGSPIEAEVPERKESEE